MDAPPRTRAQRQQDTLDRLAGDVDLWVSTASAAGEPHLIPLSFLWDGSAIWVATAAASATARNLVAGGRARLALGVTRDVVVIEGTARAVTVADLPEGLGDSFATRTTFDPRRLTTPYLYFRIVPLTIRAWREENELPGRLLLRDGRWLSD